MKEYGVIRDADGAVIRPKSPSGLRTVVSVMQETTDYGELLSADRHRSGFRPWGERSPGRVTGAPTRPEIVVKTPPLPDEVLAPLLTACLHLVDVLGPHVVELREELRADRLAKEADPWLIRNLRDEAPLAAVVEEHLRAGRPLPRLEDWQVATRLTRGWDPHDPLLEVSFLQLLRPTGHRDIGRRLFKSVRPLLEAAVAQVGTEYRWCRDATDVSRADNGVLVPWSLPLPSLPAQALVRVVGHACVITTSALTGMRSSELMELAVGCHAPAEENAPGLARHRLVGKVVKGRRWGGERDEWGVVEEVVRAVTLAEQLTDAEPGQLLFGAFQGFNSNGAMDWLRRWVASPAGQRLGLEPIPDGPVHPRSLRRTLAVEMAARPGGLLATKLHFKHLSVVTSEGYAKARELHQTGEKSQVASSGRGPDGLQRYYEAAS